MKLARRNSSLFPSFNSFWNDILEDDFGGFTAGNALPAVNVKEEEENFVIEVAAPGRKKDDFKIEVDHNVLRISSEWKQENEEKDEEGKYTRREFSYGSFNRSFTLPETVDGENINARYDNGVLFLTLPKKEEAKEKPARLIEIS